MANVLVADILESVPTTRKANDLSKLLKCSESQCPLPKEGL
jgi:hypothetical protein